MNWNVVAAFVSGLVIGPLLLILVLAVFACGAAADDADDVDCSLVHGAGGGCDKVGRAEADHVQEIAA